MPLVHARRFRVALWIALLALLLPLGITIGELVAGGTPAWIRLAALLVIAGTLVAALSQQRGFEARVRRQQAADEAVRASEAKFSGILAIAADAIISVDASQKIVHFNHGAEEIFGYRADEVIGQPLDLLLPPRTRAAHEGHMIRFAAGPQVARRMGERREIFGLRRNGQEFPAEASISKLEIPTGMLFTVVLRDVTEHKRAEEDEHFLAAASAELGKSLDLDEALRVAADSPVPRLADACLIDVMVGDDTYRRAASTRQRIDLSPALNALAAVPLTIDSPSPIIDVIRRGRAEVVSSIDDSWLEANEELALIPEWRRLGARALLIVPLSAGAQKLGSLTLIGVNDRSFGSEQQLLAEKYAALAAGALANAKLYGIAQRANRARDEVLGVVSHDLRNPISAIAMCVRALEGLGPADEAARREMLVTIRESTEWINRLIQDLLDVAIIESGKLSLQFREQEAAPLALQARHMFEVEAAGHDIQLDAKFATNLPLVFVDGARIVQALGNLLRNAIKFTPNGGRIAIAVEAGGRGGGGVGGGRVEFSVKDSGPGIPLENQARLFDRYWQSSNGARARGAGLGLSIAKGIVEAHGGEIWVRSIPGDGSTFTFAIPTAASPVRGER
jgi:PAS domain S-box-containing protein